MSRSARSLAAWGLLLAMPLAAQVPAPRTPFRVRTWTTGDGLPRSALTALARDRDGYLWIGSLAGLARFDGDTFATRSHDDGGVASPVRAVATERSGQIWVASDRGIGMLQFDGRLANVIASPPPFAQKLAVASRDSIWTSNLRTVWFFRGSRHEPDTTLEGLAAEVRALRTDSTGALWIAGTGGLVRVPSGGKPSRVQGLPCRQVNAVEPDTGGAVWIGTCRGLARVSQDGLVSRVQGWDEKDTVVALLREGPGLLWVASRGRVALDRVSVSPAGAWHAERIFSDSGALAGATPMAMAKGEPGTVWIGTNGSGLILIRQVAVTRVRRSDGLADGPVHNIVPDGEGGLWMSGGCSGLGHWRGERARMFRPPQLGLRNPCVLGMLRDSRGHLWIGEPNGLVRLEPGGRSVEVVGEEPTAVGVVPLLEDRRGRVWFASTAGRLGYAARDGAATFLEPGVLPRGRVWSLLESEDGLWVGQEGTLTHVVDGVARVRLTERDHVPPGPIRSLEPDRNGALWMASYGGGIARYKPGEGVRRLVPSGLPFELAQSAIVIDSLKRFWFLGDAGLLVVEAKELNAAVDSGRGLRDVVLLGEDDGMPEGNSGFPNAWLDPANQRLWVATVDGAASVDAGTAIEPRMPRFRLDQVRIDGTPVTGPIDTIVVPAQGRTMELLFSTPNFRRYPTPFRYRLRGYEDWITGSSNTVRYTDVPPGRYAFELVPSRTGNAQPEFALEIPVVMRPSWWETRGARLAMVLFAILGVWGIIHWMTKSARERAEVLQREIDERRRAEEQAAAAARNLAHVSRLATAGELATSIAHELNQPLTAIVGSAQTARRRLPEGSDGLREVLDDIVGQSARAAGVLSTLRAFVMKHQVAPADMDFRTVVTSTLGLLRQELRARSVSVQVQDFTQGPMMIRGDLVQLQQVLVNLLLNAAEAMSNQPERDRVILLGLGTEPGMIRLSITDQGPGIPGRELERIFEPFFTSKPNGLGLGLSLSRTIMESHGGRLWAESTPGVGSSFHVVMPLMGR